MNYVDIFKEYAYVFTNFVTISCDLCVDFGWSYRSSEHIVIVTASPFDAATALLGCCLCFVVGAGCSIGTDSVQN